MLNAKTDEYSLFEVSNLKQYESDLSFQKSIAKNKINNLSGNYNNPQKINNP